MFGVAGSDGKQVLVIPRIVLIGNVRQEGDFSVRDGDKAALDSPAAAGALQNAAFVRSSLMKREIAAREAQCAARIEDIAESEYRIFRRGDDRQFFRHGLPFQMHVSLHVLGKRTCEPGPYPDRFIVGRHGVIRGIQTTGKGEADGDGVVQGRLVAVNQGGYGGFDGLFVQGGVFQGDPSGQSVAAVGVARQISGPPRLGVWSGR